LSIHVIVVIRESIDMFQVTRKSIHVTTTCIQRDFF